MPFHPGQIVDHYRLDQVVARGRATLVFSASDLRLRRKVAFKVLNDEYSAEPSFRDRFEIESTTAAQLGEHPHIVTVYDAHESAGSLYFVTQFIEGVTLQEFLHRQPGGQPLTPAEAMLFLDQIASALDFAHRKGIVHRDVKPGNIMIKMTETPRTAYLIDFGITKHLETDAGEGNSGTFIGTADYASPEQIRMAVDIDRRADVYSLACTAFEMFTGRSPYASAADDPARISAQLTGPIPSAVALQPRLPAAIDPVFAQALAKDRVDRYETCGSFVDALRQSFPADALEYRRLEAPGGVSPAATLDELPKRTRRRRRRILAGLFAVLVLAAGAAVLASGDEDSAGTDVATSLTAAVPPTATTIPSSVATTVAAPATAPTSTVPSTTTPPTTAAPTTVAPPTTVLGPFGDVVGLPVAQPTTAQGAAVFALQARKPPGDIANPGTPTFFYAEWLRLVTVPTSNPIIASAGGYLIDANGQADLTAFELGTDGKVVTFAECTASCTNLTDAIAITPVCTPGPECIAFASETGGLIAFQRAAITLRSPAITLLFTFTSPQAVTAVSDATGAVKFDAETGYFSVTLPSAPPNGTESVATVTFADASSSRLTITYG